MIVTVNPRWLRVAFVLYILAVIPFLSLGLWQLSLWLVPELPIGQRFLAIQVVVAFYFLILLLRQAQGRTPTAREWELEASKEKFLTLYEQSPVPYVTVKRNGDIETANLAAARLFGVEPAKLLGRQLADSFVGDEEHDYTILFGKMRSGAAVSDEEVKIVVAGDETRWVRLSIFTYKQANERLVSLVDITHQKAVDRAKSEFVALAAHQLRTPIAAIRWNIELLRMVGKDLNEKQQTYIEKVERNALRMITLINDFLSVSKLETGTFSTTIESINLTEFFDSIVDEFQGTITEKRLQVTTDYKPQGIVMKTDQRLLHIITSNLLSNAVKYAEAEDSIDFGYQLAGGMVTITVADTGIGVPADELPKLFTKFYRASNAQSYRAEGTGLGLYIVKQSVEQLGGTISVRSEVGEGTVFTATLPFTA